MTESPNFNLNVLPIATAEIWHDCFSCLFKSEVLQIIQCYTYMARGNSTWHMSKYLGLFPKMHDVKFRKHLVFDPSFFVDGLKLRPSVGFYMSKENEIRVLLWKTELKHHTRVKIMGKHIPDISKTILIYLKFNKLEAIKECST